MAALIHFVIWPTRYSCPDVNRADSSRMASSTLGRLSCPSRWMDPSWHPRSREHSKSSARCQVRHERRRPHYWGPLHIAMNGSPCAIQSPQPTKRDAPETTSNGWQGSAKSGSGTIPRTPRGRLQSPSAGMLCCRSHRLRWPLIPALLRAGGAGQGIEPSQPGEPHEIRVVRVKSGGVLNCQRRDLRVCHQISRRTQFL